MVVENEGRLGPLHDRPRFRGAMNPLWAAARLSDCADAITLRDASRAGNAAGSSFAAVMLARGASRAPTLMSAEPPAKAPAAPRTDKLAEALPPGTRFGEFEILRRAGRRRLRHRLPGAGPFARAAGRAEGVHAVVAGGARRRAADHAAHQRHADTFAAGLRSFVNEARLLARFDHPSLVKVYRFWEDNGTAYMVMPYLRGRHAARHAPRRWRGRPTRPGCAACSAPLLEALEQLHQRGRATTATSRPTTSCCTRDGRAAAAGLRRRAPRHRRHDAGAHGDPQAGYAPIEQYAEMSGMKQGPWTDVYALAR